MTVEELLKRSAKKAAAQAAKQAAEETQDQILRLIEYMCNNGETDQLPRLREDPDFLHAMLAKYHLLNSEDTI